VGIAVALQNGARVHARQREELLDETPERSHAVADAGTRPGDPEAELLEGARRGEVSAFERLFASHGERMKSLAGNLLGNPSEAEDAVQETFLKIYRAAPSFRGAARISTWAYRVLVNTCYDWLRRRSRRPESPAPSETSAPDFGLSAPESDHPLRVDLAASLAALDPKRRAAFVLFEVEGFSHREVGDILGVPEGASRSLVFEARRELQRRLWRGREARP